MPTRPEPPPHRPPATEPVPPAPRGGDAVTRWVARHQVALWRHARLLGCPAHLAEEFTHDALLAGIDRGLHLERRDPTPWLRTVVTNLWRDAWRRHCRRRERPDTELVERCWQRHAPDDDGDGYLSALRACLERLDGRARRALDLRYAEGATRAEIAAELGLGDEGTKTLLRRTRSALRRCVNRRRGLDDDPDASAD